MIEDNLDDEALLFRQLKKAGLDTHVKVIHDGKKALKYLTDPRFDCTDLAAVFLDLKLPHVSGIEILDAMRAQERFADVPVIVMTSCNRREELEKCLELGITAFVAKPLTFASFAKAFADTFQAQPRLVSLAE